MRYDFSSAGVAAAFDVRDPVARQGLLALRELILDTASDLPDVGPIEETLKWGQPAYLTPKTRSGSTLRLGIPKSGRFALFVHCRTSLIPDYLDLFEGEDRIEGTRAILFDSPEQVDPNRHGWLIRRALTYHL